MARSARELLRSSIIAGLRTSYELMPRAIRRKAYVVFEEAFDANIEAIESVETTRGILKFAAQSPLVRWRIDTFFEKEPKTLEWIDSFSPGDVLWDVGANIGLYSLYASVCGARVLAFEPSAANYQILNKHIQLNGQSHKIMAFCLAFCDARSLGLLHMNNPGVGGALAQYATTAQSDQSSQTAMQAMIGFSIDDFISTFDPPRPNHLKIDVDGIEEQIINGAKRTLESPELKSIVIELDKSQSDAYLRTSAIIEAAGFKLTGKHPTVFSVKPDQASIHNWHYSR